MSRLTDRIVARYLEDQRGRIASDGAEKAEAVELAMKLGLLNVVQYITDDRFLGAGDNVSYAIEDKEIGVSEGQELLGLLARLWREENPDFDAPAIFQDFVDRKVT